MRLLFKSKGLVCCLFLAICSCVVSLPAEAFYPLDQVYWRSSNFGEYRSISYLHDGSDISAPDRTPVKSVKDGVIEDINLSLTQEAHHGYGKYLLIKHDDNTKSRYCHLSSIPSSIEAKYNNKSHIAAGELIGYTGKSGTPNYHLHFEYWDASGKKIDPIAGTSPSDGLDQPNNGNAYLHRGPRYRLGEPQGETTNGVYIVTPGKNGSFDGSDDELWANGEGSNDYFVPFPYYEEGNAVRVVIEAYDKIIDDAGKERKNMTTVPNKIHFKVTDADGNIVKDYWGRNSEYWINFGEISFNSDSNRAYLPVISDTLNSIYSTTSPLQCENMAVTHGRIYLFWKWCPKKSGLYKLNVEIYDAYRSAGSLITEKTDSEDVNLYLGIYEGSHFAGVEEGAEALKILHAHADPEYFSPNSTTGNLPGKSTIYASGNKEASWVVRIFNQSGDVIKTIDGGVGERTTVAWDNIVS